MATGPCTALTSTVTIALLLNPSSVPAWRLVSFCSLVLLLSRHIYLSYFRPSSLSMALISSSRPMSIPMKGRPGLPLLKIISGVLTLSSSLQDCILSTMRPSRPTTTLTLRRQCTCLISTSHPYTTTSPQLHTPKHVLKE